MAELTKWKSSQVKPILAHNMRRLSDGKINGNDAIDATKTDENYSIVQRGETVAEINKYRHDLLKEIFYYRKRKDVVHAIEYVCQLPRDCPSEQEKVFFQAFHDFVCEQLPMGGRAILASEVHVDEFYRDKAGNIVLDSGGNVLSHKHIHIMAVPAVPDKTHDEYEWKLCANDLTTRGRLKMFHQKLQVFMDERGIKATVSQKNGGDGKTIGLSVKQLKEITRTTGLTIDKPLTVDRLAEILAENRDLKIRDKQLKAALRAASEQITELTNERQNIRSLDEMKAVIRQQQDKIQKLEQTIERQKEHIETHDVQTKESEWGTQQSTGWGQSTGWEKEHGGERTWNA